MVIGVCTVSLLVPGSSSLKDKRHAVKGLKQRLRQEFNLSVAEVADHELWQRATLALAVVADGTGFADEVLAKAVDFVRRQNDVELLEYHTEMR